MTHTQYYELLVSDPKIIKGIKTELENTGDFIKPIYSDSNTDDTEKTIISSNGNSCKVIRTSIGSPSKVMRRFPGIAYRLYDPSKPRPNSSYSSSSFSVNHGLLPQVKKPMTILSFSRDYFSKIIDDKDTLERLLTHIPDKYSLYTPLLLFNNSEHKSFNNTEFLEITKSGNVDLQQYFTALIQTVFSNEQRPIELIAINKPIERDDIVRQPHNLQVLFDNRPSSINKGHDDDDNFWCEVKQNGVWQIWNPFHTMFSRGNIKEKKRILDDFEDVSGNDVVDLYCGIGYFSFSYMQLQCRYLFGFELNPYSVDGFKRGLAKNKYFGRRDKEETIANIYCEDNVYSVDRIAEFRRKNNNNERLRIRHVNMGLLPSSKAGWPVAISILNQHNSWSDCPVSTLHIHENVGIECLNSGEFVSATIRELTSLGSGFLTFKPRHLEKIKTFAPDVWHVCLDVDVTLAH